MNLGTFNIDWAKLYGSKTHIHKIEELLNSLDIDILILTESVMLSLPNYPYVYRTKQIPTEFPFEELDYGKYLNGNPAFRVSIYSKVPSHNSFDVTDSFTSVCRKFDTPFGAVTVYGTIIGTWFTKMKYARKELENCKSDCKRISKQTETFCLAGDLNTSFKQDESEWQMKGIKSKKELLELCRLCNLDLTTDIKENIDHIFLSKPFTEKLVVKPRTFIEKNALSDHSGVSVQLQKKYIS